MPRLTLRGPQGHTMRRLLFLKQNSKCPIYQMKTWESDAGFKPASSERQRKRSADLSPPLTSQKEKAPAPSPHCLNTLQLKTSFVFPGVSSQFLSTGCLLHHLTYGWFCLQKALVLEVWAKSEPHHNKKQVFPVPNLGVYNVIKYPAAENRSL